MKSGRASDRAYAQLRSEILEGRLPPGLALGEVEQSARLGISRTPLREALARLASEGLVESPGSRGVVVAELSSRDVDALFEMRSCLEAEAARLAAQKSTPAVFDTYAARFGAARRELRGTRVPDAVIEDYYALIHDFDDEIDTAADNPYLLDALATIRTHVARVRRRARHSVERLASSADEHALIAEAIAAGDVELAAHAVHVHLHLSRRHFREGLPSDSDVAAS
ncbi:MAG: GntR family transcriptional regulator [Lapillicoccus sp.]